MNPKKTSPSKFKVGQVYQMSVASRSHVTQPYYVVISAVFDTHIVTSIPKKHSTVIMQGTQGWDYHLPRMKYIGDDEKSMELTKNQKLI